MSYNYHRRCIFDTCCLCCSVETGAKIIGYVGVMLNSINIILSIVMIVALAVVPVPSPDSDATNTIQGHVNVTKPSIVYDIINYPDPAAANSNFVVVIISIVFGLVVSFFTLFSSVVLLIGLYKKRPSYVKFSLTVGVMRVALMFVSAIMELPSEEAVIFLFYLVVPIYFLLVIRSAYNNMSDDEETQPINMGNLYQPYGQAFPKEPYYTV